MQSPINSPPAAQITNALPTAPLTTEQIQKLLDENKQLIMMILDNQSQGKLAECAQYQALLQKNLMYLAAIADAQAQAQAQAQPQAVLSQTPMQPRLQGHLIQHHQPMLTQQEHSNMLASKIPQQINNQMQLIQPQLQQQQQQRLFFPGHLGVRPGIQSQMHQLSPSGLIDPNSFNNALGSRHNHSGTPESDNTQGKQFASDK